MQVRRASIADASRLSLIGCATFIESFAHDHDGDEVVRYLASDHSPEWYARELADPDKCAWLVEEAVGCPVGYAMAIPAALPGSDSATDYELKRIYLLSKWHGGGWGSKLFEIVEQAARTRGAQRLVLSVYVKNFAAQKFYAARGFETIGRWVFEGFDTSEDFILAKTL
jgi:GNAT superfamily N-acetyltransferase